MKNFLLVFFLLMTFSVFGQKKLEGTFRTWEAESFRSRTTFTFFKNGTFEYKEGDNNYSIYGKGNYIIHKKSLKLNFISYDETEDFLTISNEDCENHDSTQIRFYLKDKDSKELILRTNISLKLKDTNKEIGQSYSNKKGLAFIELPRIYRDTLVTVTGLIDIYYGLYKNFSFELIPNSCKDIKIELQKGNKDKGFYQIIPNGTIWNFTLKNFIEKESGSKGIILKKLEYPPNEIWLYK